MYIDFHTHLDFYKNQEELCDQLSRFSGIIVAASVDAESYLKNKEIAQKCNSSTLKIIPTFGIHPSKASENVQKLEAGAFDSLLEESNLIGEIGMDFEWHKDVPAHDQERVFRYILNHCNQNKKFCVIHTKAAEKEICAILKDYPHAKPIIHWYDGPKNVYEEFISRSYMQTFGCETCRSAHIQSLLKITPKNLILAETDNPDSEPWLGGTDSSIFLIEKIYTDIAKVLGMSLTDAEKLLNENAFTLFQKSLQNDNFLVLC